MSGENEYIEQFKDDTPDQLVYWFNREVGNNGWVGARGRYLEALRMALLATGLDCSEFITEEGMNLSARVKISGSRIVRIKE